MKLGETIITVTGMFAAGVLYVWVAIHLLRLMLGGVL